MARYISDGESAAYRAVVVSTYTYEDRTKAVYTTYYGPYATAAPAKAMVNRQKKQDGNAVHWPQRGFKSVTGHVEKASDWEVVK
ncbi:hypothetical protein E1264_03810 [Actinomadura sp. KC216]|uniref:hypothetical protein n=1 Tax=Actinomadura sp. KC216 TaxID=2530370 RepID=UPI00104DBFCB|nr:hypothetical protein [Actinomadura sp. KC216]TDB90941.1 hypothetical protein E1264_03810 [Actinomadura sp. KC216]